MTSKLIVNSLAADAGVSTITFADQAKMGNAIFHSTGFTIGDSFLHSTGVNITNINATGVITATKFVGEVSVGSSITFEDNEKAYFGTGTDFSIYHNGSASYLDETGTGGLIVKTDTAFQVFNSAGSQAALTVTPGGAVELYHNTTKVLETKGYGIDIAGGFIQTGSSIINDNGKLQLGTGSDLQLYHNGTNSIIKNNTGELEIRGSVVKILGATGAEASVFTRTGSVELTYNGVKKFETTSSGVTVTGVTTSSRLDITSTTPIIQFNESDGNPDYRIYTESGSFVIRDQSNIQERFRITSAGAVGINTTVTAATKLQVQSDGTSTTVGGNIVARFQSNGSGRDATIQLSDNVAHSATISMLSSALVFKQSGTERLKINNNGLVLVNRDGVGGRIDATAGDASIKISDGNGRSSLKVSDPGSGNSYTWELTSAGNFKAPNGKGIDFSANANSSGMSSEILDDYEEGSWTPTARNDGSFTSAVGRYVKIGEQVTVWGFIPTVTNITSNNTLQCSGLPFTATTSGMTEFVGSLMIRFVTTVSGVNGVSFNTYIASGRDFIEFFGCRDDGNNYESVKHSDLHFNNSNGIRFCISYIV